MISQIDPPASQGTLSPPRLESTAPPEISLVIPAYNEVDRIGPTLVDYSAALRHIGRSYEILVIMDGTDETPAEVNRYKDFGVSGFRFPQKLGRGGAVLQGLRLARGSIVAYADADESVRAPDLERLVKLAISGEEAIVASRWLDPSSVIAHEPLPKRIASAVWHSMSRVMLGFEIRDVHCGLKVFSRRATEIVTSSVTVTNRAFEVGIVYHLNASGVRVREEPVAYVHDPRTRMPLTKAIPIMFLTLIGIFLMNRTPFGRGWLSRALRALNLKFAAV